MVTPSSGGQAQPSPASGGTVLSDKPPLPPIPAPVPPNVTLNKDSNKENNDTSNETVLLLSNVSSTGIINTSNKSTKATGIQGTAKDPTGASNSGKQVPSGRQGCSRCNCTSFSSHEWRNTCTNCRCPRSFHEVSSNMASTSSEPSGLRCCARCRTEGMDIQPSVPNLPPPTIVPPVNSAATSAASAVASTASGADPGGSTLKTQSCSRTATAEAAGFAWLPPGLPMSRLDEWASLFPLNKLPKLGTEGENYRLKQLVLQLPKQDLAIKHCRHVSGPRDKNSYQDFVSARNEIALDSGHVVVVRASHPSQSAPSNDKTLNNNNSITNNSDQQKDSNTNDVNSTSSGSSGTSPPCCFKCRQPFSAGELAVSASRFGPSALWHPLCFTCTTCQEPLADLTYCIHQDSLYCARHYADAMKPRCGSCDELIFAGLYTKALGKEYHPECLLCMSCNQSLNGLKYVITKTNKTVKSSTSTNASTTNEGGDTDKSESVGRPCCVPCYELKFTHECRLCGKKIGLDSRDISYNDTHWHEKCYTCQTCKTSLVDKTFANKNGRIFCASCYDSEFLSRCDACGDAFRPGNKKMEYKGKKWHDRCFKCVVCERQVGSKPFIIPNETDVYCVGCFEEKFATKCTKCKKVVTTGGVTFKNEAWHRECFVCANCDTMLAGQKFASREDKPYCANCFGELFAKRCTACSKPITGAGGTRFISFEGRHWHSQCFVCATCKTSMAGKGFITDGEGIVCPDCAKAKVLGGGTGASASASAGQARV